MLPLAILPGVARLPQKGDPLIFDLIFSCLCRDELKNGERSLEIDDSA